MPIQPTQSPPSPTFRPIPTEFNHDGYSHVLVERSGRGAIFSKRRPLGRTRSYEIVRLENRGAENIGGKEYPAREVYPRSEQWGITAWTCLSLQAARKKLAEITL
jgi:hypothetical protein